MIGSPANRPEHVLVRDVTLRDGLQDEAPIDTATKLAIYEALVAAGVRELEVTSFVRPDLVPALADADAFVRVLDRRTGVSNWCLVLNERGAHRALANGVEHLQFVISASEAHQRANAGGTLAGGVAALRVVLELAGDEADVELTVATAFGCPFDGPVAPDDVLALVAAAAELGVVGIGLADTIGTAAPSQVRFLVDRATSVAGGLPIGAHLHDTRGLAIANALAALEAGAVRLDASLGGLGGCPFAPGASGNVPIEDLVHALEAEGIATGIALPGLIAASQLACDAVGRAVGSHIGIAGPRFGGPVT